MSLGLRWWIFHPFSNWNIKRAARKDALHEPPIPAATSADHPPFIRRMKQAADGTIRALAEQWKKEEGKLKSKWHQVVKQLAYWTDLREKREQDFEEAMDRFRRHTGLDVEDLRRGRKAKYLFVAFVLGATEIAINEFVFRSLHESELMTIIFALTIGIVLVGVGHHLGTHARDRQYKGKQPIDWSAPPWILGSVLLIVGLTWVRWLYFKHSGGDVDSADMSWALIMVFFAVNLLILVMATWAAYAAHLPGESYLLKRRSQIEGIKARMENLEEEAKVLKTRAEHLREALLRRAEGTKDLVQQLHYLYYEFNLRHRSDIVDYPASFHTRMSVDSTIEKSFPPMVWDEGPSHEGDREEGSGMQDRQTAKRPSTIKISGGGAHESGLANPELN